MKEWICRETLIQKNLTSSEELSLLTLNERLLRVRGYQDQAEQKTFLQQKLLDLKSPFLLDGMDKACERLLQAYLNKETICVYGDFDLDGTSGLALLYEGLSRLGFAHLIRFQPLRLKEGYGFHSWVVEELATQNVSLIVTVDVGITALAAVTKANEMKIDVIITDHHLPAQKLPPAYCIVNPNKGSCSSGLGYLSGAGVAFYLVRGLYRYFTDKNIVLADPLWLQDLLEFVLIATITDMVPMVGDNRPLVKAGLKQLQVTKRAGLKALLCMTGLMGKELSSADVAIRLAPKLNALSRMELGLRPVDVLLETDEERASQLINKVTEQNSLRVQLQQEGEKLAHIKAKNYLNEPFVFVFDKSFHRGVIGLIATKLSKDLGKPCFIGALDEENGITGSARLPNGYAVGLTEALEYASKSLLRHGGHFAAAGFEVHLDHIEEFENLLKDFYKVTLNNLKPRQVFYDFELFFNQVSLNTLDNLRELEPFGQGFESPVFLLKNMLVQSIKELKGGHLKIFFSTPQSSQKIEALGFHLHSDLQALLRTPQPKEILIELQKNEFQGMSSIQCRIIDVRNQ